MPLDNWRQIQQFLVNALGSDPKVKDAARLMRMPLSTAYKNGEYQPFETRLIKSENITYDPSLLAEAINKIDVPQNRMINKNVLTHQSMPLTLKKDNKAIQAIKDLNSEYFATRFTSTLSKDFIQWIKVNLNMRQFLEIGQENFCCILHDDKRPSATIFAPSHEYKYWTYYCRSSNCKHGDNALTIIDLVAVIADITPKEAICFLKKCSGIVTTKENFIIDHCLSNTVKSNKLLIKGICQNKKYEKKLNPIMDVYKALAEIAQETANITNTNNLSSIYFSASTRYIADKTNDKVANCHRKVQLMAALELIEKVSDKDIPVSILNRDSEFNRGLKEKYTQSIQYYRFAQLNKNFITSRLQLWIAGKGQIKKIKASYLNQIFNEQNIAIAA